MANLKIREGINLSPRAATGADTINSFAQIGMVIPYLGAVTQSSSAGVITTTAPSGWLLCNGNTFSSTTYPQLFAVLGSTTLPNLTNQYIVGTTASAELKTSYGSASHTHNQTYSSVTSSAVEMASHEATPTAVSTGGTALPNHNHTYYAVSNIDYYSTSTYVNYVVGTQSNVHSRTHYHNLAYPAQPASNTGAINVTTTTGDATTETHSHTITAAQSTYTSSQLTASHSHSTSVSGNLASGTHIVPTIAVNYIIKADT